MDTNETVEKKAKWKKCLKIGLAMLAVIALAVILICLFIPKATCEKKENIASPSLQEQTDRSSIYELVKQIEDKQRVFP